MNFLVRHVEDILSHYDASVPMSVFLKNHFKKHPKLGSRDRKAISEATYLYFRFARLLPETSIPEIIFSGIQHSGVHSPFLERMLLKHDPDLTAKIAPVLPVPENELPEFSNGISATEWQKSITTQPDTFIRIRSSEVLEKLRNAGIEFSLSGENCAAVRNGTNLEKVLSPEEYVIQDWASQESMEFILGFLTEIRPLRTWDCCAGAGGKSLYLKDLRPDAAIFATDIRKSILVNLNERFQRYQLEPPQIRTLDGSDPEAIQKTLGTRTFDFILCDAPCTGSGTWGRTPEQYFHFEKESLGRYNSKQLAITTNSLPYLKTGGILAYITCSVFKEENEDVANRLSSESGLKIIGQKLIVGSDRRADTLFVTVFQK